MNGTDQHQLRAKQPRTSTTDGRSPADTVEDDLAAQEKRLRAVEDDLQRRHEQALRHALTPPELLALSAEKDGLAHDRDQLANAYDELAGQRDSDGLARDVRGSGRDRHARARAQDVDPGFPDRSVSGMDRDDAAGDRGDSFDDRARARSDRGQAATDRAHAAADRECAVEHSAADARELAGLRIAVETRTLIGQAQGLLMAAHDLTPEAAFALLVRLSQHGNIKVRDVAARLVADAAKGRQARRG